MWFPDCPLIKELKLAARIQLDDIQASQRNQQTGGVAQLSMDFQPPTEDTYALCPGVNWYESDEYSSNDSSDSDSSEGEYGFVGINDEGSVASDILDLLRNHFNSEDTESYYCEEDSIDELFQGSGSQESQSNNQTIPSSPEAKKVPTCTFCKPRGHSMAECCYPPQRSTKGTYYVPTEEELNDDVSEDIPQIVQIPSESSQEVHLKSHENAESNDHQ